MEQGKRILVISLIGAFLVFGFLALKPELENFFFFKITGGLNLQNNTHGLYYASLKPFRNWEAEPLEINARSAVSIEIDKQGNKKHLFSKNSKQILPIASLTKLMTAYIVLKNYDLNQAVVISFKAATIEANSGHFKTGETFYLKDLLYPLLMESSNEAGQVLSEIIGEQKFVQLMNETAQQLDLRNTYFFNPTGLDPDNPNLFSNYSTTEDLAAFGWFLLNENLIWEILETKEFALYSVGGTFHHKVENNNELLFLPDEVLWKNRMLGGKTGWTPRAGECLLIALDNPKNQSIIINVILGSQNRFEEVKKLTDWIYKAYRW